MQLGLLNLERGHDLFRERVQCSRISLNMIYIYRLSGHSRVLEMSSDLLKKKEEHSGVEEGIFLLTKMLR